MLGRAIARMLWGHFEREELKKFSILSVIFGMIIGTYWLIRSYKNAVFAKMVGVEYQPYAKWVSLFCIILIIMGYTKLVDRYPKYRVFYILCGIYGMLLLLFAFLLGHSTIGLACVIKSPYRIMGWLWYVLVESFGSILVMLFWAFAADTTTPESAKQGYSLLAFGAQSGGLLGALLVLTQTDRLGIPVLVGITSLSVAAIAILIKYFRMVTPSDQLVGYQAKPGHGKKKRKTDFLEGLRIMLAQPYFLGIFGIIAFYEIVVAILDYRMLTLADQAYGGASSLGVFYGQYAIFIHIIAVIFLLFGISNIERRLGLRFSLGLIPMVIAGIFAIFILHPTLTVVFWSMIFIKALNFSLNQPTKEQLYIPTTQDAKYKTKAWVEMFGMRFSKASGAGVNMLRGLIGSAWFVTVSTYGAFGIIGIWFFVALALGKKHKQTIDQGDVIG